MSELKEAYKTLQLKPDATLDQVIRQHKLMTAIWNPDRFEEERDQWYASCEIEKINWAKNYIENNRDHVLRLESKSVYRIELNQTRKETNLKDHTQSIYLPKTQNIVQGDQPLYMQPPALTNKWRVMDGSIKFWERYSSPRCFSC